MMLAWCHTIKSVGIVAMNRPAKALHLSGQDRSRLESWLRAHNTPQALVWRAQIILHAAEGLPNTRIAEEVGVTVVTVREWRKRFEVEGIDALTEIRPGRGRKREISAAKVKRIVHDTLHMKPRGATHWSCRTMADRHQVSSATVQRIWDAHGLQPHRVKTFKLSTDPKFVDKLTDIVGLYLNPPDKAAIICVDEKSQIQALDRTQPGLPMKRGRCGTRTHDYKRHGTTSLFAALNVLEGTIIGNCYERHRHQEFLKFLRRLDREFPKTKPLHLILDNYGTHTHPNVKAWLEKHPRFHLHFTPTSCSWLNLIERWFGQLTAKQLRRGAFTSVKDLTNSITQFIKMYNNDPKPFVWNAKVEDILRKVGKCKAILETVH
jgi:transposase